MCYQIEPHQQYVTVYHKDGVRVAGTVTRPRAYPAGFNKWSVTKPCGTTVLETNFKPTRVTVARLLGV